MPEGWTTAEPCGATSFIDTEDDQAKVPPYNVNDPHPALVKDLRRFGDVLGGLGGLLGGPLWTML